MMRAARFASQLDLQVAPEVLAAMTEMSQRLEIVSAERVREELIKLLCGRAPRRGVEIMVDTGLADVVLPEVPALKLETDEAHHHKDVYQHSLTVMEQAAELETGPDGPVPSPDLVLRLAALLHDVGKPATRRFGPDGAVTFRHHETVGAKIVKKRMKALRFDNDTIAAVTRLVELHMRFYGYGDAEWTDSAVRRYVRDAGPSSSACTASPVLTSRPATAARPRAWRGRTTSSSSGSRSWPIRRSWSPCAPTSTASRSWRSWASPGPQVGKAYKHLLELRLDEGLLGEEEAEKRLRAWWESQ